MKIFSKNSDIPIGIDVSDFSLKLAQLSKSRNKVYIQALASVKLPQGAITDGEVVSSKLVTQEIKKVINKPQFGFFSSRDVTACLPETKTFIKLIKVEKGSNPLADTIGHEIETYFPLSLKEIYYDWQVIKETNNAYMVLIGAAPRVIVDQYIDLFHEANLSVSALEIESTAICRSLLSEESPHNKKAEKENYGIIDIGARRSSMAIYSNSSIVTSISIPLSGNEVTDKIAKTLEINHEQAEKAKIICGLDKTKAQGIISSILADMIKKLNKRIADTIEFYDDHYSYLGKLDRILLCGGGANIKNIDNIIGEYHSINTTRGDTFVHLADPARKLENMFIETHQLDLPGAKNKDSQPIKIKQDTKLRYATALGLALRGVFTNNT